MPPFVTYLLSSVIVAIAAVRFSLLLDPSKHSLPPPLCQTGSLFEFSAKNPLFGVVGSDSPFYAPILGLFMVTGFPTSAYLFKLCIDAANAASEDADRQDGF